MYSLILNCVTIDNIRITVKTVGPAMSTYGPGALRRIILARLESKSYCKVICIDMCEPHNTLILKPNHTSIYKLTLRHGIKNKCN